MSEIMAASLSLAQSDLGLSVSGHLLHSDDDRRTHVTLEWKLPHPINAGGNPGEWLYAVLSRVVQDYDLHEVLAAEVDSTMAKGDELNA